MYNKTTSAEILRRETTVTTIQVTKGPYPVLFGGVGFHNSEANLYPLMEPEHFNQVICKNYREISPGFMRTFAGYSDWTKEAMDQFAAYYEKMQKWTDTPIYAASAKGKMHFSEEEMEAYCQDVARNLAYLIKEKGVKHLRYYCFSNELTQVRYGYLNKHLPLFQRYHEMLYRAFQNQGLDVGLLATDATEYVNWKTIDWAIENMSRVTEAYCVHIYERKHSIYDLDFYSFFEEKCREYTRKCIADDGKRLILGEIGITGRANLTLYDGIIADTCSYFESGENAYSALMLTEMIFAAINAGVFALAMWTFSDYPDPYSCAHGERGYGKKWSQVEKFISATASFKYNKWGLTRWEDDGDYSARDFYWCLGPVVKLFKRNSKVLSLSCDDPLLRLCGIMNKDFSVTVGVVNRHREPVAVNLTSQGLFGKPIRVYEYDANHVPRNKFCDLQPYSRIIQPGEEFVLAPDSVTLFTTDYLERPHSVSAAGVTVGEEQLTWQEIADDTHCYYRVFASSQPDFVPGPDNQIASTVATNLPIADRGLHYKVLSVDRSGNCYDEAAPETAAP